MKGFTWGETLIVVVVVGVLGWITWSQFELAKAKSRDVERKSDLHEISKMVKLYYKDYGKLPLANELNNFFGKTWVDKGYVYMKTVPKENYIDKPYCYKVYDNKVFGLLADLENKYDEVCKKDLVECEGKFYCFEDKMSAEVEVIK